MTKTVNKCEIYRTSHNKKKYTFLIEKENGIPIEILLINNIPNYQLPSCCKTGKLIKRNTVNWDFICVERERTYKIKNVASKIEDSDKRDFVFISLFLSNNNTKDLVFDLMSKHFIDWKYSKVFKKVLRRAFILSNSIKTDG